MLRTLSELCYLVDKLIVARQFIDIDDLLRGVNVERADTAYTIGCLRYTFPIRKLLPYWQTMLANAREEFEKRGVSPKALMGLDQRLDFCKPVKPSTRGRAGGEPASDGRYMGGFGV